jgi:hypothetical protein
MTVYLVLGGWDYEGYEVVSVHATKESAEVAAAEKSGYYHDVCIEQRAVKP